MGHLERHQSARRAELAEVLELTEAETEAVRAIDEEMLRWIREGYDQTDAMQTHAERLASEVIAALTDEQQRKYQEWVQRNAADGRASRAAAYAADLSRDLQLTPAQSVRAREALQAVEERVWDLLRSGFHGQPVPNTDGLFAKRAEWQREALAPILTPAQYESFEARVAKELAVVTER